LLSVEKMKLINIIGQINDYDRVAMKYVIDSDIHLENMFKIFHDVLGLYPFSDANPYEEMLQIVSDVASAAKIEKLPSINEVSPITTGEIITSAKEIKGKIDDVISKEQNVLDQIEENNKILKQLYPISDFDIDIERLFDFNFIKVRFGRLPRAGYRKMEKYLGDYDVFFLKCDEDQDIIYGAYFAPSVMEEKIDTIFSSLYFERVRISDKVSGTPSQAILHLKKENIRLDEQLKKLEEEKNKVIAENYNKLSEILCYSKYLYEAFATRSLAAHTKESFYIAGWVPEGCVDKFAAQFDNEPNITVIVENPEMVKQLIPPTKLKNWGIFKPFESFVEMYGLPSYNEVDPTAIFAITYSLMFGIMYGDVGHGLVLAIIGFFMARKKIFLGPILEICGVVSILFGFLYGGIFGFEETIHAIWYKPFGSSAEMTKTLIMAVVIGTVLISSAMIINIINGVRQKDMGKVLFDANGVAGFVFYWAVIIGALSVISGNSILKWWYIAIFVILPLVAVFLKHPLENLLKKRKDWMPKNKSEYFLESFFELFEILLSYITNTISFIRVGAFALNHAGMLAVVFTLAEMVGGSTSIVVIIFGNLVVIALEGLLVAIQVLRLQFYEMFSRYFAGQGRPFKTQKIL